MKNLKYLLFILFTLLYSSCTDGDYEAVEDDVGYAKHREFNEKYGFVDVDVASISNPDSVLRFNTIEEADEYLSKYSPLGLHGSYPGQSYIEVIPVNHGSRYSRGTNYPPREYRIILEFKINRFSSYKVKFTHTITSSGEHKLSEFSSGISGLSFMSSWKHDGQSINPKPGLNHILEIEVQADQITNMFLEGIGKFDSRDIRMEIEYNTSTRTGRINSVVDDKGPIKEYSPPPSNTGFNGGSTKGTGPFYGSSGSGGSSGGSGYGTGGGSLGGGPSYSSGSGFTYGTSMGTRGTGYTGSASGLGPIRPSGSSGSGSGGSGSGGSGGSGATLSGSSRPCGTNGGGTMSRPPCIPPITRTYQPSNK